MDVRQSGTERDNTAWMNTDHYQIARPFAYLNYGDADLAPWTDRDVTARADYAANAAALQAFGTGVQAMAAGGLIFKDVKQVQAFLEKALGVKGVPEMTVLDLMAAPPSSNKDKPGGAR